MKVRYLGLYAAHSFAQPTETLEIYRSDDPSTLALLTPSPDELMYLADRGAALANLLLRGIFGPPCEGTPHEQIAKVVGDIRSERRKNAGSSAFLFVLRETQLEPAIAPTRRDFADFSIAFGAFEKTEVLEVGRDVAERMIAVMASRISDHPEFDRLSETAFGIENGDHIVYSFTMGGSADLRVSRRITSDQLQQFRRDSALAMQLDLRNVFALLQLALDKRAEKVQAFVAAWSALEIMTTEMSKHLSAPPTVEGVKTRFEFIVNTLDPMGGPDVLVFRELYRVRNRLFHAGIGAPADLPTREIIRLIRTYLGKFFDRRGKR